MIQQALQVLKQKRDQILQGAKQIGQQIQKDPISYLPTMGNLQRGIGNIATNQFWNNSGLTEIARLMQAQQSGNRQQFIDEASGGGMMFAGMTGNVNPQMDNINKIINNTKNPLNDVFEASPFEDFYTARDILKGQGGKINSSIDDYLRAGDTVKDEALRQLTNDEYKNIWKTQGSEGIMNKTISRFAPEENAIMEEAKNLVKSKPKPPVQGGVVPRKLDLSKAKTTKEWGFPEMKEITTEISLDDIPKRSTTTPEYRDYDVDLKQGRKITKPIIATVEDINDPNSPIEIVDGWHRWRQAVANKDKTIPIKYIFSPFQSTGGVKK